MRYQDGAKSGEASMAQSLATQKEIFGKVDEFIGIQVDGSRARRNY